jgi:hypothetical protein
VNNPKLRLEIQLDPTAPRGNCLPALVRLLCAIAERERLRQRERQRQKRGKQSA